MQPPHDDLQVRPRSDQALPIVSYCCGSHLVLTATLESLKYLIIMSAPRPDVVPLYATLKRTPPPNEDPRRMA